MNLQLYLGYSYIGSIPIDPEAAIDPNYLLQKKQELEITHKDEIARSKSKLIFYVDASIQPKHKQNLYNSDVLRSWF
jgi:hypothetical protein